MKKLILIVSLLVPILIIGQTHVWTGNAGDQDFSNPNNWDVLSTPDENSNALISGNFEVVVSGSSSIGNLTIENQAKLTVTGVLETQEIELLNSDLELDGSLTSNSIVMIDADSKIDFLSGRIENAIIMSEGTIEVSQLTNHEFKSVTIENEGLFKIFEANQVSFLDSNFLNAPEGIFDIESNGGLTEQSTESYMSNSGLLKKSQMSNGSNGTFYMILNVDNSGVIDIAESETFLFLVSSNLFSNTAGGRIIGEGTFDITAEFENHGTVAPADSNAIGTLDFTNTFNSSVPGYIEVDLLSPAAGDYDVINILGAPSLETDIDIKVMGELNVGDTFKVITWTQSGATCNFPQAYITTVNGVTYTFDIICNPNDVTLEITEAVLSVEGFDLDETAFQIVPNPINESATFHFTAEVLALNQPSIRIYNMLGQLISETKDVKEDLIFDRNNLPSGLYFAQILSEDKVRATRQLVLE